MDGGGEGEGGSERYKLLLPAAAAGWTNQFNRSIRPTINNFPPHDDDGGGVCAFFYFFFSRPTSG